MDNIITKKVVRIDKNGSKHCEGYVRCDRCQGRGLYAIGVCNGELVITTVDSGICHKCHGSGKLARKWIERTPEYQAKLDARREAKHQAYLDATREEREKAQRERELAEKLRKEEEEREKARIKAQKAISQYVGNVGEKISIKCSFESTAWFDFKMGWKEERMFIHTFKDVNGNKLVWKTTSRGFLNLNNGEPVNLTGTVKEHSEYKEEKQTSLIRCKIEKVG